MPDNYFTTLIGRFFDTKDNVERDLLDKLLTHLESKMLVEMADAGYDVEGSR